MTRILDRLKPLLASLSAGVEDAELPDEVADYSLGRKEAEILRCLIADGPSFPKDLAKNNPDRIVRSAVYIQLQRLVDKGFVDAEPESVPLDQIRTPRNRYSVSGLGVRALQAHELARLAYALVPAGGA
jgi:hypothetical protein